MHNDITMFVKGCRVCQLNAVENQKKAGQMITRRIHDEKHVVCGMVYGFSGSINLYGNKEIENDSAFARGYDQV